MTNMEKLKAVSLEELAEWLDKNGVFDSSPWQNNFTKKYCEKCELIEISYEDSKKKLGIEPLFAEDTTKCAFCEIYNYCRHFPNTEGVPDNKEMIKMWLIEEA